MRNDQAVAADAEPAIPLPAIRAVAPLTIRDARLCIGSRRHQDVVSVRLLSRADTSHRVSGVLRSVPEGVVGGKHRDLWKADEAGLESKLNL